MSSILSFLSKYRLWVAGAIVVLVGIWLLVWAWDEFKPLPDNTSFNSSYFTFVYPRTYDVKEYDAGVVSIGIESEEGTQPYIEITRYQSDPDTALPASFDAFMKRQASALCGADGSVESVTCTEVGVSPYRSPQGDLGQKLDLTLVRKNLKTGTTTSSTYGPVYVFDTTSTEPATLEDPKRYSAIFVYPSLSAFFMGTTSPQLMDQVMSTFDVIY